MNQGLLVVFSAPSGAGKDTVLSEVLKKNPFIRKSISATTRSPRDGEIDGKDYFFVSKEKFESMIENDELLEYVKYCDNYYGTPKKAVNDLLSTGHDVVLKIEVKGAKMVRERCKEAVGIFVLPPSMKVLENRLLNRNTETKEGLKQRLEIAKLEVELAFGYDYVIVNEEIEKCAITVCDIVNAEKHKAFRMIKNINEVLENE